MSRTHLKSAATCLLTAAGNLYLQDSEPDASPAGSKDQNHVKRGRIYIQALA